MIRSTSAPKWLNRLERPLGWIAVPQLGVILVTLQAIGYFFVMTNSEWVANLALIPEAVRRGEAWRLITFLALPLSSSPIWMLFILMFLYSIVNSLEREWGAFRTTFYVLFSYFLTVAFSMAFDYPILQIGHFQSTLFLAAASLFPEMEIRIFFFIPAKMKWLAALSGVFILLEMIRGSWLDRAYILCIYSSFIVFFGPAALASVRQILRRRKYQRDLRD
ncbi:MAG: hypothetical protein H7222_04505 [Methylotenera sp.]|nr:hypothetical protein [Oligoflexia bacterium]